MKLSKLWLEAFHAVAFPSYVSRPLGPVDLLGIGAGRAVGIPPDPRRKTMLSEDMAAPFVELPSRTVTAVKLPGSLPYPD
ncbi:hypothetical protein X726_06390 [Mesorhizobium sp. L103C105A0]|nr:hypothetical protein X726_06390 [Mesorhizobium sp. L103C105A0]